MADISAEANNISEVTRRNIIDFIIVEKIIWNGRLDEVEFLSRLYDLENLPSTDGRFRNAAGDIRQHRINNYDWDYSWVFFDKRFRLMDCSDKEFIGFLCEIVHPVVRDNQESVHLISVFNAELKNDGYEIYIEKKISGQNKYAGRLLPSDIEETKRETAYIALALHRLKGHTHPQSNITFFDESESIYTGLEYQNILNHYRSIEDTNLREMFALWHFHLNSLFRYLNGRIESGSSHVHAHNSRELIFFIQTIKEVQRKLRGTKFSFDIHKDYNAKMDLYILFLQSSGGSGIPENTEGVEIIELDAVFFLKDAVAVDSPGKTYRFDLDLIGRGSYAEVYKFSDTFYGMQFALKRANIDLDEKELLRFKREFDVLKELSSPYIVDVYCYNDENNEYIMEYMDVTLLDYITKSNPNVITRKNIIRQTLRGYSYMHSKGFYHRDISPKNVLIKTYEDVIVVKISDFGLVKIPDSELTSVSSALKGCFNDGSLRYTGFNNYEIHHETYAITLLIHFILTGSIDTSNIVCKFTKQFVEKGINADIHKRFKSVSEIEQSLNSLFRHIGSAVPLR